jgi:exosortase family protein XrtF
MKEFSLSSFKPTILFLTKFLAIYFAANLVYGLYVSSYRPAPDPITRWVTIQAARTLDLTGHDCEVQDQAKKPTTFIKHNSRPIVAVYEGCNGVNVFIIFVAFIVSFGKWQRAMLWFIPLGLVVIYIFNIARIDGLFLITLYKPSWIYFTHKYLFTAFIYLIVFILWLCWVNFFAIRKI